MNLLFEACESNMCDPETESHADTSAFHASPDSGGASCEPTHLPTSVTVTPETEMEVLRHALMDKEFYLGSSGVKDALAWVQNGTSRVLVSKEDAQHAETNVEKGKITETPVSGADPFLPATLEVVVRISERDCFLNPSTFWRAENQVPLQEVKLNCVGHAPEDVALAGDFAVAIRNLRHFIDIATAPGIKNTHGVLQPSGNASSIRFRHPVFKVRVREKM